MEVDDQ
jgi:hypothetical protein